MSTSKRVAVAVPPSLNEYLEYLQERFGGAAGARLAALAVRGMQTELSQPCSKQEFESWRDSRKRVATGGQA